MNTKPFTCQTKLKLINYTSINTSFTIDILPVGVVPHMTLRSDSSCRTGLTAVQSGSTMSRKRRRWITKVTQQWLVYDAHPLLMLRHFLTLSPKRNVVMVTMAVSNCINRLEVSIAVCGRSCWSPCLGIAFRRRCVCVIVCSTRDWPACVPLGARLVTR